MRAETGDPTYAQIDRRQDRNLTRIAFNEIEKSRFGRQPSCEVAETGSAISAMQSCGSMMVLHESARSATLVLCQPDRLKKCLRASVKCFGPHQHAVQSRAIRGMSPGGSQ